MYMSVYVHVYACVFGVFDYIPVDASISQSLVTSMFHLVDQRVTCEEFARIELPWNKKVYNLNNLKNQREKPLMKKLL